jgi:hypothetical protein
MVVVEPVFCKVIDGYQFLITSIPSHHYPKVAPLVATYLLISFAFQIYKFFYSDNLTFITPFYLLHLIPLQCRVVCSLH